MNPENIVEIRDVSFSYNGASVLENVSLSVPRGDFVSLIGPNGGGKTTLLKLILGLLQPKKGSVKVFGETPSRARRRVGYVPQHFQFDQQFPIRVADVVLMGRFGSRTVLGPFRRADRGTAQGALSEVGMLEHVDRPFASLSGGQKQRVLIARALASEPELLLLDEPTSNVDAVIQAELQELLHGLNRRLTLVMVTHDVAFVSTNVKTVACINRRLLVHPTADLSGEMMCSLYGSDMRVVRHDHRCSEGGHECLNSPKP